MATKCRRKTTVPRVIAFLLVILTNPLLILYLISNIFSYYAHIILPVSVSVFFFSVCFLFARTGRIKGTEEISPGALGSLPSDFLALMLLVTPFAVFLICFVFNYPSDDSSLVFFGTAGGAWMFSCMLALVRKWRADCLFSDLLAVRMWPKVQPMLRNAWYFLRGLLTGEPFESRVSRTGNRWMFRIRWTFCAMAAAVLVIFVLHRSVIYAPPSLYFLRPLLLLAVLWLIGFAGFYLYRRAKLDAADFDAVNAQMKLAACGTRAPVCVNEDSSLREFSEEIAAIGTHLQESVAAQMKSERMKLDLITNVSHDLKTPLTSIIGYLDLLAKQDDLPPEARDYVMILQKKSERLAVTVADLFTLAKSTSGNEVSDVKPLDLVMAVRQTLADMNDVILHAGIPVKASMPEQAGVLADSAKLYRILQNILDNALRYSLRGTRIYLNIRRESARTVLSLTNTASYEMNFTSEEILQRFVRGDASRTTEGSGLGLSIAQSFMQNSGGELSVEVRGDSFTVTLEFLNADMPESARMAETEVFDGVLNAQPEEDEPEPVPESTETADSEVQPEAEAAPEETAEKSADEPALEEAADETGSKPVSADSEPEAADIQSAGA